MSLIWQHLMSAMQRGAADSLIHARTDLLRHRIVRERDEFTALPAPQDSLEQINRIGQKAVLTASWRAAWVQGH